MKLTIDTKHDSHEEILKAISLLKQLVGQESVTNVSPVNTESMFEETPTTQTQSTDPTPPDFTSFLNLAQNAAPAPEKKDVKVELF